MKTRFPLLLLAVFLLASCATPATTLPASPTPAAPTATQPTAAAAASPAASPSPHYPTLKVLMGEDDAYSVYIVNQGDPAASYRTGALVIHDKQQALDLQITGVFDLIVDGTLVYDDGQGKYIFLSPGTYTSRRAIVVSLTDKKQAVPEFCTSFGSGGDHIFWNDYIIFNNCDTFPNRPWGDGEAPSVIAINLLTGALTEVAKSDLTHQYTVKAVVGSTLQYIERYVDNGQNWLPVENEKTDLQTFDLTTLK